MQVSIIGIDLAKRIFQVCGLNQAGKVIFNKKLKRSEVLGFVAQHRGAIVAMEACAGASFWGRQFRRLDFVVKLIPPQFVKPFVKTNKSDYADAEAICEAALRPTMRFSTVKTIEQQDLQALHRIRGRYVRMMTALGNEIRGLLCERGVVIPQGKKPLREWFLVARQTGFSEEITSSFQKVLEDLFFELSEIDKKIKDYGSQIEKIANTNELCKKLQSVPGVGPVIATAIFASVGNAAEIRSGRHFGAFFGLAPKHTGSGGKTSNLGISKRGDKYVRCMLIQGAHTIMIRLKDPKTDETQDRLRSWAYKVMMRRGKYKATIALANKLARIIYALMRSDESFNVAKAAA